MINHVRMPARSPFLLFALVALLYTASGMLPGRVLVPMDIPRDCGAWKHDPSVRVKVSNSLLSDVPTQNVPWDLAARRHLEHSEMPWMNQLAGRGEHLFANPIAGLLSPFTWFRIALGLRGWAWSIFFKIFIAACSMYWFARAATLERLPASISALVYACSGYSVVWAYHAQTNVFALAPALAAAGLAQSDRPSGRNVLLVAAMAAILTAGGHPEGLFVAVVSITIFLIAARKRIVPFLAAAFAGFLMIGIQLVPFLLVLGRSHVVLARTEQLALRFRKLSIISLILPGYLGSPLRSELDLTGLFSNADNFSQRNGAFIGALVLLAIVVTFRGLPALIRRGVVIAGVAFVLSVNVPGLSLVVRLIPLMKWVAAEYFALAFVLFGALAAGPAVLSIANERRRKLAMLVTVSGCLLLLAGAIPSIAPALLSTLAHAGISQLQRSGLLHQAQSVYDARLATYLDAARWTALRRLLAPGLFWLAAGIGLLLRRRAIVIAAALLELVAFGYGFAPSIRTSEIAPEPPALTRIRKADPSGRFLMASSNEVLPPNLATLFGIRDLHAYDILTSEVETRSLLSTGYDSFSFGLPPDPTPSQYAALAAGGVRFFVTWHGAIELPGAVPQPLPRNNPPPGLVAGTICSVVGMLLLAALMWASRAQDGPKEFRSAPA